MLELLELGASAAGSSLGLLVLALNVLLDLRQGRNRDAELRLLLGSLLDGVTTLLDDAAVVRSTATVPGEDVLGVAGNV